MGGYTGADVYARMNRFPQNAATLGQAQQAATALQGSHMELISRLSRVQGKMDQHWTGDASEQAQAGLNPVIQTSEEVTGRLGQTSNSMTSQQEAFHSTVSKLTPVSDRPNFDGINSSNAFAVPEMAFVAAQWQEKDQTNKDAYGSYFATTDGNRNTAAKDYPALTPSAAGIGVGTPQPGSPTAGHPGTTEHFGAGSAPQQGTDGRNSGMQSPSTVQSPAVAPGSSGRPIESGGPSDGTTAAGYVPPSYTPKPPVSTMPGFGSGLLPTFGPGGADSSTTGGLGGVGSFSGRLGSGTTEPSPGSGTGSGQRLGSGNGAGSGAVGERAGTRTGGVGGTAGAKGAAGTSGMGAGGGKHAKEEDKEHQRKITLPSQDVDELFGGYPDGMKPVPPTIGE